jgi:phosphate transport system substrate-binding protein
MRTFKNRSRTWLMVGLSALAVTSVAFAACGDDDDDDPGSTATGTATSGGGDDVDYSSLSGAIDIEGSSTVFPIAEAGSEDFRAAAPDVRMTVAGGGTGAGFEKFCRGESQIADASRPISEDETASCADEGIEDIVEVQVGIDALTVVVNPENDWAKCMTVEQLNMAFKDGGASKWSDIDPSWPDDDIIFYYPGPDSGTFGYFLEAIGLEGEEEEQPSHRSDGTPSEDDNILVRGVEGDKNAIGYFGFAYYQGEGSKLTAVEVDNGDGCVAPSFEAALDGSYAPLSRPLFMYTSEGIMEENPQVAGFLHFVLSNAESIVADVGYVTMPEDQTATQLAKVESFLP